MTTTTEKMFDLAKARRERGLSLRQAARLLGINHVWLREIERGRRPSLEVALRVARFYGVAVEEIWSV